MLKFFAEKNVSSFCSAKATHIFSAKNIRILCIESAKTVNEMTLNELVKLMTLWTTGPWLIITLARWSNSNGCPRHTFWYRNKKKNYPNLYRLSYYFVYVAIFNKYTLKTLRIGDRQSWANSVDPEYSLWSGSTLFSIHPAFFQTHQQIVIRTVQIQDRRDWVAEWLALLT